MLAVSMSSDHGTHDAKGLKEDHAAQSQQNNPRAFLQITGFSYSDEHLLPDWGMKWSCCYGCQLTSLAPNKQL